MFFFPQFFPVERQKGKITSNNCLQVGNSSANNLNVSAMSSNLGPSCTEIPRFSAAFEFKHFNPTYRHTKAWDVKQVSFNNIWNN